MINSQSPDHLLLTTLGKNWWMVAARGAFAILFGAMILLRPGLPLNLLVAIFGVYALLDGAWAIASALWISRMSLATWPVLFEGVVSLGVGGWPSGGRSCPGTRCWPSRSGVFSPASSSLSGPAACRAGEPGTGCC
jgi:hypothetical protein